MSSVVERDPVVLPVLTAGLTRALRVLLDLDRDHPAGWSLTGGFAVHLHCWERGAMPTRVTQDADVVLAVRAWPQAVGVVTGHLSASGFRPVGETFSGHQHCWRDGDAQIDLLIPRFTGQRTHSRHGATGGTLFPTPGGQVIVDVVERLPVVLDGQHGHLPRPALANLLLGKASAYTEVAVDPRRSRHLDDLVTLAALVDRTDLAAVADAARLHRGRLGLCLEVISNRAGGQPVSSSAKAGLDRLRIAVGA